MAITLEPLVQIEFCKFLLIADIQGFPHMQNEHFTLQFYQITTVESWERVMMTKRVRVTAKKVLIRYRKK
jgi:hypothetical protein